MTVLARANGWRGFDNIATRVKGGWEYGCDGRPSPMGCSRSVTLTRRWTKTGAKPSGWLVCYGTCSPGEDADDEHGNDLDVVLTFCPSCRAVVQAQDAREVSP